MNRSKQFFLLFGLSLIFIQKGLKAQNLEGDLSVIVVHNKDHTVDYHYFLKNEEGNLLKLLGEITAKLPKMSHIPIAVDLKNKKLKSFKLKIDLSKKHEEKLALKQRPDEHKTVMIMIDTPQHKASEHSSLSSLKKVFLEIEQFYSKASYGQISFPYDEAAIYGPYLISSVPSTCDKYEELSWAALEKAEQYGLDSSAYQHKIFILPSDLGCDWTGLAEVGCDHKHCQVWIASPPDPSLYIHELGHNLGFEHASAYGHKNGKEGLLLEYGDYSDPMGNPNHPAQFNPPHLIQAGWYEALKPDWVETVEHSFEGIKLLRALSDLNGDEPNALKFSGKKGLDYYLAYRKNIGLDKKISGRYRNKLVLYSWDGKKNTIELKELALDEAYWLKEEGLTINFKEVEGAVAFVEIQFAAHKNNYNCFECNFFDSNFSCFGKLFSIF